MGIFKSCYPLTKDRADDMEQGLFRSRVSGCAMLVYWEPSTECVCQFYLSSNGFGIYPFLNIASSRLSSTACVYPLLPHIL